MTPTDSKFMEPKKCPTCGAARVEEYRPFCSKRCSEIDLGRWLTESYRVAVVEEDGGEEDFLEE